MSSKAGDEFVFDSSAFINGARHHYFLDSMAAVWTLVEEEIENGSVVVIREVYREIKVQADPISNSWTDTRRRSWSHPRWSSSSRVNTNRSTSKSRDCRTVPTPG